MTQAGMPPTTARWQRVTLPPGLVLVLVAISYWVIAELGLRLALVGESVTPLWPPTGFALVAFLVFGRRVWPAVTVAAFARRESCRTRGRATATRREWVAAHRTSPRPPRMVR